MSIVLICSLLLISVVDSVPDTESIYNNRITNDALHSWLDTEDLHGSSNDTTHFHGFISNIPGAISKSSLLSISANDRNIFKDFGVGENHVFNGSSSGDPNWEDVMKILKLSTNSMIESLNLADVISAVNITDECKRSLQTFLDAFSKWETWAVQMADANAKMPPGILGGTTMSLGSYDECLKIRFNSENHKEQFKGRYCLVGYKSQLLSSIYEEDSFATLNKKYVDTYGLPPEWIEDFINRAGVYLKMVAFWMGTCVPSTCSEHDVWQLTSHVTRPLGLSVSIENCKVDEPKIWSKNSIAALSFLCILAILCILGTMIDILTRCTLKDPKSLEYKCRLLNWIRAFSLYLNAEKCFQSNTLNSSLAFFNGLRFISCAWIIISHTWSLYSNWELVSYRDYLGMDDDAKGYITAAVVDSAHIAVETFFHMSGFLMFYKTWKQLEASGGKLNILKFAVQKYWRLAPAIFLTISLFLVMVQITSGPLWSSNEKYATTRCGTHAWKNLIFIHNWWSEPCLGYTWFLAALLQLHLVGVVILLIIYRWPITGTLLGIALGVATTVVIAFVTIGNHLLMPAYFVIKDLDFQSQSVFNLHFPTYPHYNSYFIGMAVGYIYLKNKEKEKKIKMSYEIAIWVLAAGAAFYVIYGKYYSGGTREVEVFYNAVHKTVWSLCLAWLTYSCATGHGGIINRILSWSAFGLLGNISYLAYLLHVLIKEYINGTLRELKHYSDIDLIFECVKIISSTYIVSVIAYIAVELPFATIGQKLFKGR